MPEAVETPAPPKKTIDVAWSTAAESSATACAASEITFAMRFSPLRLLPEV